MRALLPLLALLLALPARAGLLTPRAGPAAVEGWLDSVVLLITGPAYCSGAVVDERGTVATAYHCVAAGGRPRVRLRDGAEYRGRVVAVAPRRDVALVEVPGLAGKVDPLPLRQRPAREGEEVWALGHPYAPVAERRAFHGTLLWSASRGVVSAVGERFVQVDAALNPGNSGGPLVDARGRLLGVASRKLQGENLGFAAPASVVAELLAEPRRPPLGGAWGLGLTSLSGWEAGSCPTLGAEAVALLRPGLVGRLALHAPLGARWTALAGGEARWVGGEAGLALRLRAGSGRSAVALDAGGALLLVQGIERLETASGTSFLPGDPALRPALEGRVDWAGNGLRLLWEPASGALWLGVDLDVPGLLGVF